MPGKHRQDKKISSAITMLKAPRMNITLAAVSESKKSMFALLLRVARNGLQVQFSVSSGGVLQLETVGRTVRPYYFVLPARERVIVLVTGD